jgi:hypothetical protein
MLLTNALNSLDIIRNFCKKESFISWRVDL